MSPRDRRAVLLGAAAIVGALLAFRGLPWGARRAAQLHATTHERLAAVDRARDALARAPLERDALARALARVVRLGPSLVEGRSDAEAQASLSALVSLAASRHAVALSRVQPLPDSAAGRFGRATVAIEGEGDVRGLSGLLRALETTETLLTVRALSVQPLDPAQRAAAPERLRLELTVSGWYLARRNQ